MNDAALNDLLAGFRRFQHRHFGSDGSLFERLRTGQSPATMIIACCDSRADPALLTDASPGAVFVIRNVANLVPPYRHAAEAPGIRSAIEFGIKSLQVRHVVVLGHSGCGGIRALMTPQPAIDPGSPTEFEFVNTWMTIAEPAKAAVMSRLPYESFAVQCKTCELESVKNSVRNLHSFPWVSRAVQERRLTVHGWYFDMDSGTLQTPGKRFNEVQPLVPAIYREPTASA